eukprot:m.213727 g.213727  ORF g.213727 m.213727 type:complete len:293 (-) comp28740_c0_seq1:223-1101(-)
MARVALSKAEKQYTIEGAAAGVRADGRSLTDFRHLTLETGVVSNSNGSARLCSTRTDILVGVKAEISECDPSHPDVGKAEFAVECASSASPEFEARGGEQLSNEIAQVLRRLCSSGDTLDLKALCIIPGQTVWTLRVDVLVLECAGGSLLDAIVVAVKAALMNTRVPEVVVSGDGVNTPFDFDVVEDPHKVRSVGGERFPVLVTMHKVGKVHLIDASAEEEACARGSVMIGVTPEGNTCLVQTSGVGGISMPSLMDMLQTAQKAGQALCSAVSALVAAERGMKNREKVGFLH